MKMTKNFSGAKSAIKSNIDSALNEIGSVITAESQMRTPVDTGRLRRDQSYKVGDGQVDIGTNVEYAHDVEFGTSFQRAQPFLKPAIADSSNKVEEIVKKHMSKMG